MKQMRNTAFQNGGLNQTLMDQVHINIFANRTDKKAGMLNVDIPGGFEKNMPSMVKWFEDNK